MEMAGLILERLLRLITNIIIHDFIFLFCVFELIL